MRTRKELGRKPYPRELNDEIPEAIAKLAAKADEVRQLLDLELPSLVEARRRYARSREPADKETLAAAERRANDLFSRLQAISDEMTSASGIPEEVWAQVEKLRRLASSGEQILREDLTQEKIPTTAIIEDFLSGAIDEVHRIVPRGWLDVDEEEFRLDNLIQGVEPLSLAKGLRPESERPGGHRLRQSVRVARDYLAVSPRYDHFAGASLIPQLAQFGSHRSNLRSVGGDVDGKLRALWERPGDEFDSTIFELLVAAGCVEFGRSIEFIAAGPDEKSPDFRCHDPFPLLIECKRKRPLSEYEIEEEAEMRRLFLALESEAQKKGMSGRFDLSLRIEFSRTSRNDIVSAMMRQRLAAQPERPLDYDWGSVAFHELPLRVVLPGVTKLYSPNMLMMTFGWNSDLPEWDGLVCRSNTRNEPFTDTVVRPIGLAWNNTSQNAVKKRAWGPLDLFGDAMSQITPGEFGIIYLAYYEGARGEIANRRTSNFQRRIKEWEHSASIRIPISFLVRLYPRPLDHGNPDLIESTVQLCSAEYGEPSLIEDFPSLIFSRRPIMNRDR